jgi:hypothetical protein
MVSPGKAQSIAAWIPANSAPDGATVSSAASTTPGIPAINRRAMIQSEQTIRQGGIIVTGEEIFCLIAYIFITR